MSRLDVSQLMWQCGTLKILENVKTFKTKNLKNHIKNT